MRMKNSMKNVSFGIMSQVIIIILGFISRKVFLDSLGAQYLGINGLLDNVLSLLSLVEGGIGASIIYSLYKPLANDDKPKIIALIQLFKKAYAVLAVIIFFLSLLLLPFLGLLMKGTQSIPYLTIAYFIFVIKNIISYLNAHKVALINADQKGYVLSVINFGFQALTTILKIIILILYQNYVLYLLLELGVYVIQTIYTGRVITKRYCFIKTKEKYFIVKEERATLINNIKAVFLHNIGGYCVFGTDNILIASFISVVTLGYYSNYTMIIGQLASLHSPILGGIGASVGNLIAMESSDKNYSIFKVMYLINFWIYSVSVIFLYNLLEPFITWWLGKGYLLDSLTLLILLVNFYLTGLRVSISIFKSKAGIFVQDQYMPLIEAAINLIASIVLVQYLGLAGIFLGTTLSTLSIVFWNAPRLVYKHVFNISVGVYFTNYFFYGGLTIIACLITAYICGEVVDHISLISLIIRGIICLIIPNMIYLAIFHKTKEFQHIKGIFKGLYEEKKIMFSKRNSLTEKESSH